MAVALLFAAGCDSTRGSADAGSSVLTFDGAMVTFDTDAGGGPDLGAAGDPCAVDDECEPLLECRDTLCARVGALNEPCRSDGSCETDLACDLESCQPAIQGRFCHCIYETAAMGPVRLEMQVGAVLLGPSLSDTCSPCRAIPIGVAVAYEIRREGGGALVESGTLEVNTDIPEIGYAFSVGGIVAGPIACDREPVGFCGT